MQRLRRELAEANGGNVPTLKDVSETPASAPAAKRLSLSQIVEMLLTRHSDRSTVSLTRNAKGETQIDVQVRTADTSDVATVEDAERKAREVYDRLVAAYPLPDAPDEAMVELTRNAKGETQIEVQVRANDATGIRSLDEAKDAAGEAFATLRTRFPMTHGAVAGDGKGASK